jgi:hypothetical protein
MGRQDCSGYISLIMHLNPEDGGSMTSKHWFPTTTLHGATTKKNTISIFSAVKTSNHTKHMDAVDP